ncbi:MAG: 4Fe-4S dicluster domain-containing protein [Chloroflexi bacterium]|nr:4Fe-4S dicluster domain-containing protein [Chloroflexota bacterium]
MAVDSKYKWAMVVDIDRCTGCQACVVACQAENNIPVNTEEHFLRRRSIEWIRIERYWEGEYPNIKARFIPILCQQCGNAPCEPVCPVYATHHSDEGLNIQVYPRCVGVRYCANNCPYQVRFFNWFEPAFDKSLWNQLNPDVTIRVRGIIEKCMFCVHRIRRAQRVAKREGRLLRDGEVMPACVQTCPTGALVFGDIKDPESKVARLSQNPRGYKLLKELGADPNIVYLKKVDSYHG